ncbi:MAG: hypothetical protein SOV71_06710 [Anaerovoracaceae bacterium]|nr:hypothetical protein [Bacillota bacterium]MDY2671228.1 hypothetical protein [Anaerovoracaceae bacterium]
MNSSSNNTLKVLLAVGLILYIVSPIDFFPGPMDDILAGLIGIAGEASLLRRGKK